MQSEKFNPFTDRLSRNIRNQLSVAFPEALARQSLEPVRTVADRYRTENLPDEHEQYITDRLQKYETALASVSINDKDALVTAGTLWDLGLFFEVHEILEPQWYKARGDRKLQLQAVIRAVAVYMNLDQGYQDRAAKISKKAIPVLEKFQMEMSKNLNIEALISALQTLNPSAPKLSV